MKDHIIHKYESVNITMTKTEFLVTVSLAFLQTILAFITIEDINVLTACLGFAFLVLRNLPYAVLRIWEVISFIFNKRQRNRITKYWRDEINKRRLAAKKQGKDDDGTENIK